VGEVLAVRWHARGDVRVEEVPPPPPPGPGEVQLQVRWCGICGTDLEEWLSGPLFIPAAAPHPVTGTAAPVILGHEFAGVVAAVGAASPSRRRASGSPSTRSSTAAPATGAGAAR
jgi:(R,R)-butanediol dehydrogenase/meso-butanediol dehydrogenase/diacetyl reductase